MSMLFEALLIKSGRPGTDAHIELARRAIQRMADGLDKRALASKCDMGTGEPQRRLFPVADVLQQLEPTWQWFALKKRVSLRVRLSSASVRSDSSMLTTILDNLVGSAIKYGLHTTRRCR